MSTTADFIPTIADVQQSPALEPPADTDKPPRHRKIGQLPRVLRDRVNTMLDDSHSAREIIEALKESQEPVLPYPISEMNISDWRRTGYQKYLAEQERLALVRAHREAAHDMIAENDTTSLAEGALQMLSSQYFDIIGDFSTSALKEKLQDDPLKYSRFLNVFARLTREIVNLKKQREAAPQAAPAELPQLDEDRKLNENEQNLIQDRWDQCFKIHPNHLRSKTPITPESPCSRRGDEAQINPESPSNPPEVGIALRSEPSVPVADEVTRLQSIPSATEPSALPVAAEVTRRNSVNPETIQTPEPIPSPCRSRGDETQINLESTTIPPEVGPARSEPSTHPVADEVTRLQSIPSATEPQPPSHAAIETPNESAICHRPSAIQITPEVGLALRSEPSTSPVAAEVTRRNTDLCPQCGTAAPPLLATGERPHPHCAECGQSLPPPQPKPSSSPATTITPAPQTAHAE